MCEYYLSQMFKTGARCQREHGQQRSAQSYATRLNDSNYLEFAVQIKVE